MSGLPRCVRLDAAVSAAHERVFAELLAVNEASKLHATLRVAGGWVRDHILGIPSTDIDIAIESPPPPQPQVSGEQFAREVARCAALRTGRTRTVGVIRVNPALSKHIETATVCVADVPVEFCALRSDDYSADSRIPRICAATPREDALRRDYTINALFYNLHTRMVEDYTTGLDDLQPPRRILRCPLDPAVTLTDDPLRLLRGIRFVGQLGAFDVRLDAAVLECVNDELIDALQRKVSRERVGKEVTKMLTQPYADACVRLLISTRLLQRVVLVEVYVAHARNKKAVGGDAERIEYMMNKVSDADRVLQQVHWLNTTLVPVLARPCRTIALTATNTTATTSTASLAALPADEQLASVLFALLVPHLCGDDAAATAAMTTMYGDVDDRLYAVCVHGLKLPASVCHVLRRMFACYCALQRQHLVAHEELCRHPLSASTRVKLFEALGALHDRHVPASAFRVVLFAYFLLASCAPAADAAVVTTAAACPAAAATRAACDGDAAVATFVRAWAHVERDEGLLASHTRTLPLRGNELPSLLGVRASDIGGVLHAMRKQLLLQPTMTREDLLAWLQATRQEGQSQQQRDV